MLEWSLHVLMGSIVIFSAERQQHDPRPSFIRQICPLSPAPKKRWRRKSSEVSLVSFGWRHRVLKRVDDADFQVQQQVSRYLCFLMEGISAVGSTLLMVGGQGFNSLVSLTLSLSRRLCSVLFSWLLFPQFKKIQNVLYFKKFKAEVLSVTWVKENRCLHLKNICFFLQIIYNKSNPIKSSLWGICTQLFRININVGKLFLLFFCCTTACVLLPALCTQSGWSR